MALRDFLDTTPTVEKVGVLPYHTMGKYKWQQLGLDEPLKGINPPTEEQIKRAEEILIPNRIKAINIS